MPQKRSSRQIGKEWCLGTGFVALDIVRSINGRTTEQRFAGGSCGNVLTILSYLGWKSAPIARIGDDHPGIELVKDLERWSVDTRFLFRETAAQTPIIFQEIVYEQQEPTRHKFSRTCPVCDTRTAGYRPLLQRSLGELHESIPPSSVFYFDRVARSNFEIASRARQNGALVVFEPSGVKEIGLFTDCLRISHIFKYSNDRLSRMQEAVNDAEVPLEIETRGSAGLRVKIRKGKKVIFEKELPALSAPRLRDAAGSGDWCTAGLIHALLLNRKNLPNFARASKDIVRALRWGQALAALNCSYEGARGLMYAMSSKEVEDSLSDLLKGKDVRAKVSNAEMNNRPSDQCFGTCVLCDRKLEES